MIHDATVEVTCDAEHCHESVFVRLEWVYRNMDERTGHYDSSDKKIEEALYNEHDWAVRGRKHFCSNECAEKP